MNIKNRFIKAFLFFFLVIMSSCDKDPVSTPEVNIAPEIITMSASPSAIGKNQSCQLTVLAVDKNSDNLNYKWSANAGVFLQRTNSKITTWQAPNNLGRYECKVIVYDDVDTTVGKVNVDVVDVANLKVLDEVVDMSYNLTSDTLKLFNTGKVDLKWKVIANESWIEVEPEEGTTINDTSKIKVTIDRSGFSAGDFEGIISIKSNGGNKDILVKLTTLISPDMVLVPAGTFEMGSLSGAVDEQPVHEIYLDDYYIDKYEVTNQQYVDFLNELNAAKKIYIGNTRRGNAVFENGMPLIHIYDYDLARKGVDCPINFEDDVFITERGTENYPVCFLTWYGATLFAEHIGKRLPTEAEWEKAARGSNSRKYPWGNSEPTRWDCNYTMNVGHPTMVGFYSPLGDSPYGCADMAGNAWEWCSSLYKEYPYNSEDGRENMSAEGYRTIRGGGWDSLTMSLSSISRYYCAPLDYYPSYGLRCAKSNN